MARQRVVEEQEFHDRHFDFENRGAELPRVRPIAGE
jgi:hypothetical protein